MYIRQLKKSEGKKQRKQEQKTFKLHATHTPSLLMITLNVEKWKEERRSKERKGEEKKIAYSYSFML